MVSRGLLHGKTFLSRPLTVRIYFKFSVTQFDNVLWMRSRSARDTAANACSRQLGNRRDQCPSLRTPTRRNCIVLTAAGRRHPLVSGRWGVERNLVRPLGLNRYGLNKDLVLGLLMPRRRQEPGTDFPERDFLPFSLLFSNVRVNRISSRPAGQRTGLPSWLPFGTSFFWRCAVPRAHWSDQTYGGPVQLASCVRGPRSQRVQRLGGEVDTS